MADKAQQVAQDLSAALRQFDLQDLADRALNLEFSDFSSPHTMPKIHLVTELELLRDDINDSMALDDLIDDIKSGKFDG